MSETKLTALQEKFLDLLFADGIPDDLVETAKNIKEAAGYAANTPIYSILRPLADEIAKRNQECILFDSSKSIRALQNVVRTPTLPGAKNLISAANSLLDRGGIGKKENTEIEIKADKGIVILPAKLS